MSSPDRLTLLGSIILVLPLLLFLPGYVLTRTFLRPPSDSSLTEVTFLRVLLSFLATSVAGIAIASFSWFTGPNLVLTVILLSFLAFLIRRFRLFSGSWGLRLVWGDFWAILVLGGGLLLFLWPSEEVGSVFTLGAYLARVGNLRDPSDISILRLLQGGPLGSIWFAIVDAFFGLKFSLLTIPFLSLLSLWALFFLAKRMWGLMAAVAAVSLLLSNFAALWFYRLPEGYALAQLLILGAFYLTHLYFGEGNVGFLVAAVLALALAPLARHEVWRVLVFFGVAFLIVKIFMKGTPQRLPVPFARFFLSVPLLWLVLGFEAPHHVIWAMTPWLWVMAGCGSAFFLWGQARASDLVFLSSFMIYPLFEVWVHPGDGPYMMNLAGLIPVVLPSVSLFAGYLLGFLSRVGRIARIAVNLALVIMAAASLYLNRHLVWSRDGYGLLRFYETFRRSFLPGDLVFSGDKDLASLLWRLFGLKVYEMGQGGPDLDFQREIRRWLKDGGWAYVISRKGEPRMEGFNLKLHSVERLRAFVLEKSDTPPEQKVLEEILVRIYEAMPNR